MVSQAKARAQRIDCVSNLHQLGLALQSFVDDNHAYPSAMASTNSDNPGPWASQLEHGGFNVSKPITKFITEGVWRCPSVSWRPKFGPEGEPCYGYNAFGVLKVGSLTNNFGLSGHYTYAPDSENMPIGESEVVTPCDMIAIGDALFGGEYFMRVDLLGNGKWNPSSRHQGKANVLLCDGHVESPMLEALFVEINDVALVRWNRDHQPHREQLN
jgi:prepilin-type processing-associated H-X9-DG protein